MTRGRNETSDVCRGGSYHGRVSYTRNLPRTGTKGGAVKYPIVIHCWEEGPLHYEPGEDPAHNMGVGSTCLLLEGHAGPHELVRDDDIFLEIEVDKHNYRLLVKDKVVSIVKKKRIHKQNLSPFPQSGPGPMFRIRPEDKMPIE